MTLKKYMINDKILNFEEWNTFLKELDNNLIWEIEDLLLSPINPENPDLSSDIKRHRHEYRGEILFILWSLRIQIETIGNNYVDKNSKVRLSLNEDAVILATLLIRTYIPCANFNTFYPSNHVLLGRLIYKIQCIIYMSHFLKISPVKGPSLDKFLHGIDFSELTEIYMKILIASEGGPVKESFSV